VRFETDEPLIVVPLPTFPTRPPRLFLPWIVTPLPMMCTFVIVAPFAFPARTPLLLEPLDVECPLVESTKVKFLTFALLLNMLKKP